MTIPVVGEIVHFFSHTYVDKDLEPICQAAIVSSVHEDGFLGLWVFSTKSFVYQVADEDESRSVGSTWHHPFHGKG